MKTIIMLLATVGFLGLSACTETTNPLCTPANSQDVPLLANLYTLYMLGDVTQDMQSAQLQINHVAEGSYTINGSPANTCAFAGGWVVESPTQYGTFSQAYIIPGVTPGLVSGAGLITDQKSLQAASIPYSVVTRVTYTDRLRMAVRKLLHKSAPADSQSETVLVIDNSTAAVNAALPGLLRVSGISITATADPSNSSSSKR